MRHFFQKRKRLECSHINWVSINWGQSKINRSNAAKQSEGYKFNFTLTPINVTPINVTPINVVELP